ncbi:MAG: GtrA family protein [Phreatobacter sp.]|uniref:GtrA family protein n=1 Tax=Phreatobacter sp. TaxID=1966341 RepID=UPI001A3ABD99|nr:GtrA family protein [Phreatobacter sp.]MBL8571188.1 GtrA family protein [Phreatobacter sp.]
MRRVALFGAVGLANTAIDFLAFLFLAQTAGVPPLFANAASFTLGAANSYILNRLVTFADAAAPVISARAMARFAAVTIVSLTLSSLALAAGLALSLGVVPAKIVSVVITFVVSFLLNRYLVFSPAVRPKR